MLKLDFFFSETIDQSLNFSVRKPCIVNYFSISTYVGELFCVITDYACVFFWIDWIFEFWPSVGWNLWLIYLKFENRELWNLSKFYVLLCVCCIMTWRLIMNNFENWLTWICDVNMFYIDILNWYMLMLNLVENMDFFKIVDILSVYGNMWYFWFDRVVFELKFYM